MWPPEEALVELDDPDFVVVLVPEVVALSVPELVFVAELESVSDAVSVDFGAVVAEAEVADAVLSSRCQRVNTGKEYIEILTSSRRTRRSVVCSYYN